MTMMGLSLAAAAAEAAATSRSNLNGKYSVASVDKQDVPFPDDYASKGMEYFDVWSPEIATTYGENFWTSMGDHPLPPEIVKRFAGKVIAITGYEQDQVMVDPVGQPGINPERDLSVPINWAYNHHYETWMTGADAQMVEVPAERGDYSNHGAPTRWVAVDRPSAARNAVLRDPDAPTSLWFSEGNGGESRKSFHGYPAGYAQLLNSPTSWRITPMQIDTRRRDCGVGRESIKNCTAFEPWLEPKQARYGRPVSAANYSGVLECPCNSRFGGDPSLPRRADQGVQHNYGLADGGIPGGALPNRAHASPPPATSAWPRSPRQRDHPRRDRPPAASCAATVRSRWASTPQGQPRARRGCAGGAATSRSM